MFDWLFKGKNHLEESYKFNPTIQISPQTNLFIQCTPNDPHTASNIVLNTYISKTNRTLLQTRIQWRRFKFINQSEHSVEHLTYVTGNVYRCQPSDLGAYINAKITSVDVSCTGEGEVTIGPIRIDQILKNIIDGALYDGIQRSLVKISEKNVVRNAELILTNKEMKFFQESSREKLIINYNLTEPRIQLNPKDPTRIYLRFQHDEENNVRNWLNSIFPENISMIHDGVSQRSKFSSISKSSRSRLFKNINKIQVIFLSRNYRDFFLFTQKAFLCKQLLKNSIVMEKVQQLLQMKTVDDYHRFLKYMSLRYQIHRLAEVAKQLQKDRDQKVKDIAELEDSIGEMTLTYMRIIEEKGKSVNIDFSQSYSEISMKREEIMGKRNFRELKAENQNLKEALRRMNEELEYQKLYKQEFPNSLSPMSNPFVKKMNVEPFQSNIGFEDERSRQNFLQINMQYAKVLQQNQKLKSKHGPNENSNISQDMVDILESLERDEQDPAKVIARLQKDKKDLIEKVKQLEQIIEKKSQSTHLKLNKSVAHQQLMNNQLPNTSQLQEPSIMSTSNVNQSIVSEYAIKRLEEKLFEIRQLNTKMMEENIRLRKQRDQQKSKNISNTSIDIEMIKKLKGQNEQLFNERNILFKKNQLLMEENRSLKIAIDKLRLETKSSDGSSIGSNQEMTKLKALNDKLSQQIKYLKLQLSKKSQSTDEQSIINENFQLKQELQKLTLDLEEKDSKIESQATLIDRLMNSTESNSFNGKDKSRSETYNEESVEKLKKKIKLLQEEILILRKSADVINRSHDFSMEMNQFNEEKLQNLMREKQMLIVQNERISKMCQKFSKDAREKNKWQRKALQLQRKLNAFQNSEQP